MPAFEYIALNGKGRQEQGILEADSARQERQLLTRLWHWPRQQDFISLSMYLSIADP